MKDWELVDWFWFAIIATGAVCICLQAHSKMHGQWEAYTACIRRDGFAECGGLKP